MLFQRLLGVVMVVGQVLLLQTLSWYGVDMLMIGLGVQIAVCLLPLLVICRAYILPLVLPTLPRRRMTRRMRESFYFRWICGVIAWRVFCFARGQMISAVLIRITTRDGMYIGRSILFIILGLL